MGTIPLPAPNSLPEINEEVNEIKENNIRYPTQEEINLNHEQRIQSIEAALLRIRGAI